MITNLGNKEISFPLKELDLLKKKLFYASKYFTTSAILIGNSAKRLSQKLLMPEFDILAGFGATAHLETKQKNNFDELQTFHENQKGLLIGVLGYDLKNEIENLKSENPAALKFPKLFFFRPEFTVRILKNSCHIYFEYESQYQAAENLYYQILNLKIKQAKAKPIKIKHRSSKKEYLANVKKLQQHIQRGNIYEINYCIDFFAKNANIAPEALFLELYKKSKSPFSFFMKFEGKYIISASPERFLKKKGNTIFAQPMKGTIHRGQTEMEDNLLKNKLLNNQKELSENIMIVDLKRNDLAKTARKGSIKVEELCGVYAFEQVFQMISTISSMVKNDLPFTEIIKNCFPPGSMTGAPKVRAMELIEAHENFQRGFYSGIAGYILPNGDFDFNVIIRTILYNSANRHLSFSAGSAITAKSNPEKEYEECLLKIRAIEELLTP